MNRPAVCAVADRRLLRHDIVWVMSTKDLVLNEALKLTESERLEIASRLFESVDGPGHAESDELWAAEIRRRIDAIDSGRVKMVPWDEARKRTGSSHG